MKPSSILFTIIIALAALGLVVWVGQYHATTTFTTPKPKSPADEAMPLPKSEGPTGKAEIEGAEYEFGAKKVGDSDEHTFTIKNSGQGTLQLKLGKPTCQCTVGEITRDNGEVVASGEAVDLAPGGSVNILVKWNMKAEIEKFRQSVPVYTTDPDLRQIDLTISGSVENPIKITPVGYWDVGEILRTEPTIASGFVYSTVLDSFTLTEVPRDRGQVKVTIEPAEKEALESKEAKSGFKVSMEFGPNVPIGLFTESVKLKVGIDKPAEKPAETISTPAANQADSAKPDSESATDSAGEIIKEVTVSGRRSGPIEIRGSVGAGLNTTSNRLIFSDFRASEGKKATITVFAKGMEEELVIKSLDPSDTPFKARILGPGKAFGNSKSYQIEIEIPPGPVGKHRELNAETVDLILNHPEAPDLKLLIDYDAKR